MNKFTIFLILCGSIVSFGIECNDCRDCPLPPTINGNYLGIYAIVEIHSGTDTVRSLEQPVYVEFRKPEYSFELEPGEPESLRVACNFVGQYVLSAGVILEGGPPNSADSCSDTSLYPRGFFALDQKTDTMRLTRDTTTADSV
jgi:hypothetical protein